MTTAVASAGSEYIMKQPDQETKMDSAPDILTICFWSVVGLINFLLLIDLLFNGGSGFINFLILITGGDDLS